MVWMKRKTISLAVQAGHLGKHFPSSISIMRRSKLTWIGNLCPSPLSGEYKVRLTYKLDESPDIDVLEPKLEERDGKRPPHLYPKDRLCLYLPRMNEWNSDMLLVETIVPWASEWLMNYEIWLATGEWCGGGEHPDLCDKTIRDEINEMKIQRPAKRGDHQYFNATQSSRRRRRPK